MRRRRASVSLLGIFGLLAYLTSSSSPIQVASHLPEALALGYFSVPTSWLILVLGFIPVGLGMLPEEDASVDV